MMKWVKEQIKILKENKLGLTISISALSLSVVGARLPDFHLLVGMVSVLVGGLVLAQTSKIQKGYYPYLLYSTALSLLLQVTLLSNFLIGTDIHLENWFAYDTLHNGWNLQLPHPGNSSLFSREFIPAVSNATGLSTIWILKTLPHILFAFVPVVLYYVFRKWLTERQSFYACTFFIIMPSFFLELQGITKQEVSELLFSIILLMFIREPFNLRTRLAIIFPLFSLIILSHYSSAFIFGIVLVVAFVVKAALRIRTNTPLKWYAILIVSMLLLGGIYYTKTSSGMAFRYVTAIIPGETRDVQIPVIDKIITVGPALHDTRLEPEYNIPTPSKLPYMENHEPMVQSAIGMDFFKVSNTGKAMRILQYGVEVLIVVGFIQLWRTRKKTKDFFIWGTGGALLLILCVVIPGFSATLNVTRFFHITLMVLAPCLIVGIQTVFKKEFIVPYVLLIPYFLFSSGTIFEVTKMTSTNVGDTPFSIPMTNHRIDLGGSITEEDRLLRDLLAQQPHRPIYGDVYAILTLQDIVGLDKQVKILGIEEPDKIPSDCYIIIRSRNTTDGSMVVWKGIGLREEMPFTNPYLQEVLKDRSIIYRIGDAKILGEKNAQ